MSIEEVKVRNQLGNNVFIYLVIQLKFIILFNKYQNSILHFNT